MHADLRSRGNAITPAFFWQRRASTGSCAWGGRILLEQAAMTIRLGENRESGYGAAKFILDPTNRSVQQS